MTQGGRPLADYMDALADVEARWPVAQWSAAGVALWPLLRLRWMFAEWFASAARQEAGAGGAMRARVARAGQLLGGPLRAAWTQAVDRHPAAVGSLRRDLVFLSDGLSFASLAGRWVERFCDPLIAQARQSGLTAALWTPLHRYLRPRHSRSCFVQPVLDRATLRAALAARTPTLHLPGHAALKAALQARGFTASALEPALVARDVRRLLGVAAVYERRLVAATPRAAFVVGYYSLEGMAFVLACRRLGITSVDLQHGVQGPHHAAYAAWPRPQGGTGHALLPNRFWVWSPAEAAVIRRWCADSPHTAFVGGNPWLDVWRPGAAWAGAAEALAEAAAARAAAAGRRVVLVTLQFGLAPAEQLEPLERLLEHDGGRSVYWVRLHPVMREQRESVRARLGAHAHCELDRASDLPLHALLPYVDAHLTHSSSTVLEAADAGIRSVVTSVWGAELYADRVAAGDAVVERGGAPALLEALIRAAGRRRTVAAVASRAGALRRLLDDTLPQPRLGPVNEPSHSVSRP